MNIPRLFAPPHPGYTSRRDFFAAPAAASACSRLPACSSRRSCCAAESAGSKAGPVAGQGQVGHLAVHERRPEPGRHLGLQARAGKARRPGADGLRQEHRLLHRPGRAADEVAVQVRAARPVRARGSRRSFPNMAKHVDEMAFIHSCCTESNNHSPALFKINTGMTPHGLSLRRLLGDLRPGHREPEPAGASS